MMNDGLCHITCQIMKKEKTKNIALKLRGEPEFNKKKRTQTSEQHRESHISFEGTKT